MNQPLNTIISTLLLLMSCISHGQTKSSLELQAHSLIAKLKTHGDYPFAGNDTLIDLNGDHFKDILIEYYGLAGTGLKNRVSVYLYETSKKKFVSCKQLNSLANPTFYFNKKIVVGYYIGHGGGHASKFKWNGLRLDTLEYIDVNISWQRSNMTCKLVSFNYLTHKTTSRVFDHVSLPKEYNYWDYKPLIDPNSR